MFWMMSYEERPATAEPDSAPAGRFELHRHRDALGPHLDLRVEQEGYLVGWRIDGTNLAEACWATEKMPHDVRWLEQDGDAVREDAGVFTWLSRGREERRLLLQGGDGARVLVARRDPGLPPAAIRAVREALDASGGDAMDAGRLIADGVTARRHATERFCGLGRELDGEAFEEGVWRRSLQGLSLEELHCHLRAYEIRFDRKYPPAPVSRPERLREEEREARSETAAAILREPAYNEKQQ